ncbi:putative cytochrome P450 10 [Apostichopus japonicus]|uniref:Putative cytochrome P450 10 n=1 Tax=Stichopus japonicus TaxID=307972 RepID=A0A2G8K315_STIJA|nr:putative cytochrome P450 10 [Apostichopus japonicus]
MISDLLNDLLLGAIDTTSSTFSFIIYNLAKNPECQEKVYEEISRVLSPDEPVTPEVLQMLPYLKACVKESARLFPTIDGTSRILDKNITLSGYNIPANSIIRIHAVAGMMSEYVPEPEKFQPERWLRAADRSILANPYLTITFGVGFAVAWGNDSLNSKSTRDLSSFCKISASNGTEKISLWTLRLPVDQAVQCNQRSLTGHEL